MTSFPLLLAKVSLDAIPLIAAVWLLGRIFPRRMPPSLRCGLWWLASMRLLVGLVAPTPFDIPLLPAPEPVLAPAAMDVDAVTAAPAPVVIRHVSQVAARVAVHHVPAAASAAAFPWAQVITAAWLAGVAVGLLGIARDLVRTRALRRGSRAAPAQLQLELSALARELGVTRLPELLVSADAPGPLAVGLLRPAIVLPAEGLCEDERRMVLVHELAHLKRFDLWLGWIPIAARVVFFFNPLARLVLREYAVAREAACDAEVVSHAQPALYGRLLVRLGAVRRSAVPTVAAATPAVDSLKRRLEMLQHVPRLSTPRRLALLSAFALAGLIPFHVVARERAATPAVAAVPTAVAVATPEPFVGPAPLAPDAKPTPTQTAKASKSKAAPTATPDDEDSNDDSGAVEDDSVRGAPRAPSSPSMVVPPMPAMPAMPAMPDMPKMPDMPQVHVNPQAGNHVHVHTMANGKAYDYDYDVPGGDSSGDDESADEDSGAKCKMKHKKISAKDAKELGVDLDDDVSTADAWVLFQGDQTSMHGTDADLSSARKARKGNDDLLWFRRGEKTFVVRDEDRLEQVATEDAESKAFGAKQAKIALKEAQLGKEMAQLQLDQAGLEEEMAKLEVDASQKDGDDEAIDKAREVLDQKQEAIEKAMEKISAKQEALGDLEDQVGDQQSRLGDQMEARVRAAIEKALKDNAAEKLR